VASLREPAPSGAWQEISDTVRETLLPLVRELRQTMAACRAQTGAVVSRAILTGGGSRLRGMASFLTEELELPVSGITAEDAVRLLGVQVANRGVTADTALLALGAALEGATAARRSTAPGPLAYKQDFSFLRAKAGVLVACGLLLVAFFAATPMPTCTPARRARHPRPAPSDRDHRGLRRAGVGRRPRAKLSPKKEESPMPRMTAFDLLTEISKRLPPRGDVKLDVIELTIEPKKIYMKAIAESQANIDAITKKLKEIDCFTDVQLGRVETVNDGRQFTLTTTMKCM